MMLIQTRAWPAPRVKELPIGHHAVSGEVGPVGRIYKAVPHRHVADLDRAKQVGDLPRHSPPPCVTAVLDLRRRQLPDTNCESQRRRHLDYRPRFVAGGGTAI